MSMTIPSGWSSYERRRLRLNSGEVASRAITRVQSLPLYVLSVRYGRLPACVQFGTAKIDTAIAEEVNEFCGG